MPSLAPSSPCPICKRPSEDAFKPFCSGRCRDVDLHRWMAGVYAVPAPPDHNDAASLSQDAEDDAPGQHEHDDELGARRSSPKKT